MGEHRVKKERKVGDLQGRKSSPDMIYLFVSLCNVSLVGVRSQRRERAGRNALITQPCRGVHIALSNPFKTSLLPNIVVEEEQAVHSLQL